MSKKVNTPIELLETQLRERFPAANISLDPAKGPRGTWFLDIDFEGHFVVIQWRPDAGFGISCSAEYGIGEGADEVYKDLEAAYGRTVSLLLSRTHTSPPEAVLRELRKERGLSQVELAKLLNKQQGEISKLERRSDVKVSTVRNAVEKLGGKMTIIVTFPDGMERALKFDEDART
jgi:hypothetical protein